VGLVTPDQRRGLYQRVFATADGQAALHDLEGYAVLIVDKPASSVLLTTHIRRTMYEHGRGALDPAVTE
jgi:hypothetical protein